MDPERVKRLNRMKLFNFQEILKQIFQMTGLCMNQRVVPVFPFFFNSLHSFWVGCSQKVDDFGPGDSELNATTAHYKKGRVELIIL